MKRIRRGLVVLAAAALAMAGLGSAAPASAAVHQAPRANAATDQVPHTKAAWQADLKQVRTPGRGCFSSSYPALTWHAVTCGTGPKMPSAPARPAAPVGHATPAQVGAGTDYVATVPGYISEATGTFGSISSNIYETGLVGNTGTPYPNAFSLQLNSNPNFTTAACSGTTNLACKGWQQFLYTFGTGGHTLTVPQIYMQYWLFDYGTASAPSTCPSGWNYAPAAGTSRAGCWVNSKAVNVPAVTVGELGDLEFSGAAESGGTDEVSLVVGSEAYAIAASDSVLDLAAVWDQTEWGVYGDTNSSVANFGAGTSL